MDTALEFLSENSAIYEEDYPYAAKDEECWQEYIDKPEMFVETDYMSGLPKIFWTVNGTKEELQSALINVPVSVAIQADRPPFRNYQTGIIDDKDCGDELNHGVTAIGFGTEGDQFYFIVKNSWGPRWGEGGFVRIAPGSCGILTDFVYAYATNF